MILPYNNLSPKIAQGVFIAPNATIIGDVEIGEEASIWFNTVVRGDVNYIRIGAKTNIQDLCMCHVTLNKWPLIIGEGVTIGHSAVVHGCVIKDYCLIGMGARSRRRAGWAVCTGRCRRRGARRLCRAGIFARRRRSRGGEAAADG